MSSQHAIGLEVLLLGTLDDERRPGRIVHLQLGLKMDTLSSPRPQLS